MISRENMYLYSAFEGIAMACDGRYGSTIFFLKLTILKLICFIKCGRLLEWWLCAPSSGKAFLWSSSISATYSVSESIWLVSPMVLSVISSEHPLEYTLKLSICSATISTTIRVKYVRTTFKSVNLSLQSYSYQYCPMC